MVLILKHAGRKYRVGPAQAGEGRVEGRVHVEQGRGLVVVSAVVIVVVIAAGEAFKDKVKRGDFQRRGGDGGAVELAAVDAKHAAGHKAAVEAKRAEKQHAGAAAAAAAIPARFVPGNGRRRPHRHANLPTEPSFC